MEPTENSEKSEPQMGFEPTTLRDLVGCSNHWATGDSVASKGEMWVFDPSCITQPQSEITTDSIAHNCITQSPLSISEKCISDMLKGDCVMQLWAMLSVVISLCSCVMQLESKTHISPLLVTESPVAQWLEHPTRSRRVVSSNPIWGSDFSEFSVRITWVIIFWIRK